MAAASKRFLGLGFTFAATDKGLEKKLKAVSDMLSAISNQLENIGKASSVASKGMKSFVGQEINVPGERSPILKGKKLSSLKSVPSYGSKAARPPDDLGRVFQENLAKRSQKRMATSSSPIAEVKVFNKVFTDKLKNLLDKQSESISKSSHSFIETMIADARKKLDDNKFAQYLETIGDLNFSLDQNGDVLSSTMKMFIKNHDVFTKRTAEASKEMYKVKVFFGSIKQYFKEVFGAAENFLDSIGIRIREMIPPQVGAAFNLAKTLIAPLLTLPSFFKKIQDEKNKQRSLSALESMSENGKRMYSLVEAATNEITGKVDNPDGLNANIKALLGKDEKKPTSFLDKLKNFFTGLPVIGPLLGMLGKALSFLLAPLRLLGGFLPKLVSGFIGNIGAVIRFAGRWAAPILVIGSALWGFVEGILDSKEKWGSVSRAMTRMWEAFTNLSRTVFNKLLGALESGWNYLLDKLGGIADLILTPIKNAFSGIGSAIVQMLTNIFGQDVGNYASMIGEAISEFFKSLFEIAFKFIKNPLGMIKEGWKEIGKVMPDVLSFGFDTVAEGMENLNDTLGGTAEDVQQSSDKMQEPVRAKKENVPQPSLKDYQGQPLSGEDNSDIIQSQKGMASKIDTTNSLLQQLIRVMQSSNGKQVAVNVIGGGGGVSVDRTMNAMRARDNFHAVNQGL